MTKEMMKVLALVEEMYEEEKKTQKVPHYYKRNGKIMRRSYDDEIYTARYVELFHGNGGIRGVKVFKCNTCGEMVDYFNLESWKCNFSRKNGCVCAECYANEMGEDL